MVKTRKKSLDQWLNRFEPDARTEIEANAPQVIRIRRNISRTPMVSLIIPTRDRLDLLKPCVTSILERTSYSPFELLIVDNDSREPETMDYFESLKKSGARILSYPCPFNYSAMNNLAVEQAKGEIVCLLNNDLELITKEWLEEMLALLLRNNTAVVGAKLIWPNNLVQHGGVITGVHHLAVHVGNDWLENEPGYMYRNITACRWSAVTGACMLTRREEYLQTGGMDHIDFPVTFNDVDYCLKLTSKGRACVWTPHARFYHHESATRGRDDTPAKLAQSKREMSRLRDKWGEMLINDPFHNPNFSLSTYVGVFDGLAIPPGKRSLR